MGMKVLISVLVPWLIVCVCALKIVKAQKGYNICDVQGCNCNRTVSGWRNVNCVLDSEQELQLQKGHIPESSFEIYISGGKSIHFGTKTFSSLRALTLLHMENIGEIIMERNSFFQLDDFSFLIRIHGCDNVLMRSNAFGDMKTSLSIAITKTSLVTLESSPFTKLYNCTFKDIGTLNMAERSFEVKKQDVTKNHGPATVLMFINVKIPNILNDTFLTSLAQLTFHDCRIGEIHPRSVTANTINALSFVNTTVGVIRGEAFAERTLVYDFRISLCLISRIERGAIRSAMSHLVVNHSNITTIEPKAITTTVASVQIIGNQIADLQTSAFTFTNWNDILIEDNFIKELHANFIDSPLNDDVRNFTFKGNVIYQPQANSLDFVSKIQRFNTEKSKSVHLVFNDNDFEHFCHCNMSSWMETLINSTTTTTSTLLNTVLDTSFCPVNDKISKCFNVPTGLTNILNFTQHSFCKNTTLLSLCDPISSDSDQSEDGRINTSILNNNTFFNQLDSDDDSNAKQSWLIFIIVIVGAFIIALVATFVALLIRGSRWLKRKGYFRNMHYSHEDRQRGSNGNDTDEENTIVTMDENEKLEVPEELTLEFLQILSQRLDDPGTHQEASEMIERLYEMFIVDDSNNYDNNNRQQLEEEAHLYEELGNLNLQIPPPPYREEPEEPTIRNPQQQNTTTTNPRGILKMMEEKVNLNTTNNSSSLNVSNNDSSTNILESNSASHANIILTSTPNNRSRTDLPQLSPEYSEPSDVAVHFYSELLRASLDGGKNKSESLGSLGILGELGNFGNLVSGGGNKGTLGSDKSGSGKMALRPLPNKPSVFEANPSKF